MNIKKTIQELQQEYPTWQVYAEPADKSTMVSALNRAPGGLSSVTVSVIDEIPAHHHKKTAEIYYVMKGSLTLFVNGETFVLKEGDYHIVPPGDTHWGQGNGAWVEIYAEPGFRNDDMFYGQPQATVVFPHQSRLVTTDVAELRDILTSLFHCTVLEEDKRRSLFRCGDSTITVVSTDTLPTELKSLHGYVIIEHSSLDTVIKEAKEKKLTVLFRQGALAFLCDSSHNIFELHERQSN